MVKATKAIGARLGMPDLPYVELPPETVRDALRGAGMSGEAATLMVDMQLALNDGRYFEGVERAGESMTPTRLEDFLATALPTSDSTVERKEDR